jgi:hypothetical protein
MREDTKGLIILYIFLFSIDFEGLKFKESVLN